MRKRKAFYLIVIVYLCIFAYICLIENNVLVSNKKTQELDISNKSIALINLDQMVVDNSQKLLNVDLIANSQADEEPLLTLINADDINLKITAADLATYKIGDKEYNSIASDEKTAIISLKSKKDITSCKYSLVFELNNNSFENKYLKDDASYGTLENQLILHINNDTSNYDIDVNNLTNNKYKIENIVIEDDSSNSDSTSQMWKVSLEFRNYKSYNQVNNANKSASGILKYEIEGCERISKGSDSIDPEPNPTIPDSNPDDGKSSNDSPNSNKVDDNPKTYDNVLIFVALLGVSLVGIESFRKLYIKN